MCEIHLNTILSSGNNNNNNKFDLYSAFQEVKGTIVHFKEVYLFLSLSLVLEVEFAQVSILLFGHDSICVSNTNGSGACRFELVLLWGQLYQSTTMKRFVFRSAKLEAVGLYESDAVWPASLLLLLLFGCTVPIHPELNPLTVSCWPLTHFSQ